MILKYKQNYQNCIIVIFFLFLINSVYADLLDISWNELIKESNIIAITEPRMITIKSKYKDGFAELDIIKYLKGNILNDVVKVNWSAEAHDQKIDSMVYDWLIFVTFENNEKSKVKPTRYGYSYFKIDRVFINNNLHNIICYDQFHNINDLPQDLIQHDIEIGSCICGGSSKADLIFLDDLIRYFDILNKK